MSKRVRSLVVFIIVSAAFFTLSGFEPSDVIYDKCGGQKETAADCSGFVGQGAGEAKNVILVIGDGMGIGATYAGRVFVNGPDKPMQWEELPHRGLVTTCAVGGLTDSAAAGTALATGHKTRVGTVSMGTGINPPSYSSILEQVKGVKATGLVTTTMLWDATPAVFAAHAKARSMSREIARQMVEVTSPDVMLGGGADAFYSDGKAPDMVARAKELGYTVVTDAAGLEAIDPLKTKRLLGLFATGSMEYEAEREPDTTEPHLTQMAKTAISVLSADQRGFFLMIEGARIDHSSHSMDMDHLVHEMAEFNNMLEYVLSWADSNPGTLVLITADHETGGIEVKPGDYKAGDEIKVRWTAGFLGIHANHSTQEVPIYGEGPNAGAIRSHMDNTEVYCVMENAFGAPAH